MGAGKTTIGARLAAALGWPLSDSDEVISRTQGATVRQLNERLGAAAIHRLEADHLCRALASEQSSVIAAAASVVERAPCRRALTNVGVYPVWLRAPIATLTERFAGGAHRPYLAGDAERLLRRQARERARWFGDVARLQVAVERRSPEQLAEEILVAFRAQAGCGADRG